MSESPDSWDEVQRDTLAGSSEADSNIRRTLDTALGSDEHIEDSGLIEEGKEDPTIVEDTEDDDVEANEVADYNQTEIEEDSTSTSKSTMSEQEPTNKVVIGGLEVELEDTARTPLARDVTSYPKENRDKLSDDKKLALCVSTSNKEQAVKQVRVDEQIN